MPHSNDSLTLAVAWRPAESKKHEQANEREKKHQRNLTRKPLKQYPRMRPDLQVRQCIVITRTARRGREAVSPAWQDSLLGYAPGQEVQ